MLQTNSAHNQVRVNNNLQKKIIAFALLGGIGSSLLFSGCHRTTSKPEILPSINSSVSPTTNPSSSFETWSDTAYFTWENKRYPFPLTVATTIKNELNYSTKTVSDYNLEPELTLDDLNLYYRSFGGFKLTSEWEGYDLNWLSHLDPSITDLFLEAPYVELPAELPFTIIHCECNELLPFDEENYGNLNHHLKTGCELDLIGNCFDLDYINSLTNVTCLSLDVSSLIGGPNVYNYEWNKLNQIPNLNFKGSLLPDLAIVLSTEDITLLKQNGVTLTANNEPLANPSNAAPEYYQINQFLTDIISNLNISSQSTETEKLEEIIIYIVNHYHYNKQIGLDYYSLTNPSDEVRNQYDDYQNRIGVCTTRTDLVCRHYTALTNALAHRLGINIAEVIGVSNYDYATIGHVWNVVSIEGETYYLDVTWLDTQTVLNIEDPSTYQIIDQNNISTIDDLDQTYLKFAPDKLHQIEQSPYGFDFDQALKQNSSSKSNWSQIMANGPIEQKQFKLTINQTTLIVSGAILIGILAGLGLAFKQKPENKLVAEFPVRKQTRS